MLVLSRKEGEQIKIGEMITITVVRLDETRVRIGIEAPQDVPIDRAEVAQAKKKGIHSSPRNFRNTDLRELTLIHRK